MTQENMPTVIGVTFVLVLLSLVMNAYTMRELMVTDFAAATATGVNAEQVLTRIDATNARLDAIEKKMAEAPAPAPEATAAVEAPAEAPK